MTVRIPMKGATLKLTITGTPTLIPQVQEISDILGGESAMIDVTDLDSTAKQSMGGLIDWGEMAFKIFYDYSDSTHVALYTQFAALTEATFLATLANTAASTVQVVGPIKSIQQKAGGPTNTIMLEVKVKINSLTQTA